MSGPNLPQTPPQFRTAEYSGPSVGDRCKFCNQALTDSYFRVNRVMACAACVEKVKLKIPKDNHAAFTRALIFGVGGAILGLILYATFSIVTGWIIGYVALAVGWIVGKAMMTGSGGIGGRRYQIVAVILTYAAVSLAAIPIDIAQASKSNKAERPGQSQVRSNPGDGNSENSATPGLQGEGAPKRSLVTGGALLTLAMIGLASPFLELQNPFEGMIGLVILLVGMQFAWKMTRGVSIQILGPFKTSAPPAAPSTA
jgi:hypothetical protein